MEPVRELTPLDACMLNRRLGQLLVSRTSRGWTTAAKAVWMANRPTSNEVKDRLNSMMVDAMISGLLNCSITTACKVFYTISSIA